MLLESFDFTVHYLGSHFQVILLIRHNKNINWVFHIHASNYQYAGYCGNLPSISSSFPTSFTWKLVHFHEIYKGWQIKIF